MITFSRPRKIGYKTTSTDIRLNGKPIASLVRRFGMCSVIQYPNKPRYLWLPVGSFGTVKEAKQAIAKAAESIHAHQA